MRVCVSQLTLKRRAEDPRFSLVIRSSILNSWDPNTGVRSQHTRNTNSGKQAQPQTPTNYEYDARDDITTQGNLCRYAGRSGQSHTSGTKPSPPVTFVDINHKRFRYGAESRNPLCKAATTIPDIMMHIFHILNPPTRDIH